MAKAAFLDRDGVINQKAPDAEYVTRWEDFHLMPGAIEGVTQLNRAGFFVIAVTNQRCIAKGLLTEEELETLHLRMTAQLSKSGATIDGIYYCPSAMELKNSPATSVDADVVASSLLEAIPKILSFGRS